MRERIRIKKSSPWNPPTQQKSSEFARPFIVQRNSDRPPTQEEIEDEAFDQHRLEAFRLQLWEKYNVITPAEQERLGVLQAKMKDFWQRRRERASRFRPRLGLSVFSPDQPVSPPVQPKLTIQPSRDDAPPQTQPPQPQERLPQHPATETPSGAGGREAIQAKGDMTGNRQVSSAEQRPNQTGLPDHLPDNLKEGVENLSDSSMADTRTLSEKQSTVNQALAEFDAVMDNAPQDPQGAAQGALDRIVERHQLAYARVVDADGQFHVEVKVNPGGTTVPRINLKEGLSNIQGLGTLMTDAKILPQGVTFDQYITRMLQQYEATFEQKANATHLKKNASKIGLIVRALARDLARQLGNPWLAPEIGQHILEYYGSDLYTMLGTQNVTDQVATGELASTLASADPIMLYMTDKISLNDAANKIAQMAQDRQMQPAEMFELLNQQFQLEIGTFSKAEIQTGQLSTKLPSGRQSFKGENDLIGEISSAFFARTADLDDGGNTQWGANGLLMYESERAKLNALSDAVTNANPVAPGPVPAVNGREHLTEKQKRYMHNVEEQERTMNTNNMRDECNVALRDLYAITEEEANTLIDQYVNRFNNIPLTTSFDANVMFANAHNNLTYQSALKRETQQTALSTILATRSDNQEALGNIETIGLAGGGMAAHRKNPAYIRWRFEKDAPPPGYGGLGIRELPEFGALSPSFFIAQGSESNLNKLDFGRNQYGASHLVYKPAVRDRAMYQLTAKGPLRRDPIVLLHDILVKTQRNYINANNALQQARNSTEPGRAAAAQEIQAREAELHRTKEKRKQALNISHALMSFIINGDTTFLDQQQIELQIFGNVKIENDVQKIVVGSDVKKKARRNLTEFAHRHKIKVTGAAQPANTKMYSVNTQEPSIKAAWMMHRYLHSIQDWRAASSVKGKPRSRLFKAIDAAIQAYEATDENPIVVNQAERLNSIERAIEVIIRAINTWRDRKTDASIRNTAVTNLEYVTKKLLNMIQNLRNLENH